MAITYTDTEQMSSIAPYRYVQPKYAKSTTDPTYYEPAATRIANMRKASGVILEGIYDYYSKDDVSKFNEKNFSKNISKTTPDFKYVKGLTQEEISQVANDYADKAESMLNKKKDSQSKKAERINESIETSKAIQASTESSESSE